MRVLASAHLGCLLRPFCRPGFGFGSWCWGLLLNFAFPYTLFRLDRSPIIDLHLKALFPCDPAGFGAPLAVVIVTSWSLTEPAVQFSARICPRAVKRKSNSRERRAVMAFARGMRRVPAFDTAEGRLGWSVLARDISAVRALVGCIGRVDLGALDAEPVLQIGELGFEYGSPAVGEEAVQAPGEAGHTEVQALDDDLGRPL